MLNISIPAITGTTIPVVIKGHDTAGCELVLRYPTNAHRYAMYNPQQSAGLNTIFKECVMEIKNPFKINDVEVVSEDFTKYPQLADAFDEAILWIMKSLGDPEKN